MSSLSDADLHAKYYGAQDATIDAIKNSNNKKFIGDFVEKRHYFIEKGHRKIMTFSTDADYDNKYGYTNMQIIGDAKSIDRVQLELSDMTIDSIYPKIINRIDNFF